MEALVNHYRVITVESNLPTMFRERIKEVWSDLDSQGKHLHKMEDHYIFFHWYNENV